MSNPKGDGDKPFHWVALDTCGRTCTNAVCKSTSNLQRCGRCCRVYYCSKDCQRADWNTHKGDCQKATAATNEDKQDKLKINVTQVGDCGPVLHSKGMDVTVTKLEQCKKCNLPSESLKTCGKCSKVSYCSKKCQKDDWSSHKKQCRKTEKRRPETAHEAGIEFKGMAEALGFNSLLKRRSPKPELSWDQAVRKVRELHPDKMILTKLEDVPEEYDLDPEYMTSTVFLARLSKPHPYVIRHAWYLQDKDEEEIRVFFYLDHGKPEPYFKWSQLDCGNFLCLEHPYIHTFLDSSTGIRIDDACDVSVIGD